MAEPSGKPTELNKTTSTDLQPGGQAWRPFEALHDEIDRLFDEYGHAFPRWSFGRRRVGLRPFWRTAFEAVPAVDVVENETSYQFIAELPGLDEKDVEVSMADNVLTIKGEKKDEKEEKKKEYYRAERRFGSFRRSFELPAGVDQNKIEANFQKGVLTITLPKTAEAQKKAKKIPITAK